MTSTSPCLISVQARARGPSVAENQPSSVSATKPNLSLAARSSRPAGHNFFVRLKAMAKNQLAGSPSASQAKASCSAKPPSPTRRNRTSHRLFLTPMHGTSLTKGGQPAGTCGSIESSRCPVGSAIETAAPEASTQRRTAAKYDHSPICSASCMQLCSWPPSSSFTNGATPCSSTCSSAGRWDVGPGLRGHCHWS